MSVLTSEWNQYRRCTLDATIYLAAHYLAVLIVEQIVFRDILHLIPASRTLHLFHSSPQPGNISGVSFGMYELNGHSGPVAYAPLAVQ
jgi:hypothetical protein